MKKILSFIIITLNLNFCSGIINRIAEPRDLEQLLQIQEQFTQYDKSRLLVYPIQVRADKIVAEIKKQHLFVAVDENSNRILGITKLFLIDSKKELNEILEQELNFTEHQIIENCAYFYFGSAYTLEKYRGDKINSKLIKYALSNILQNTTNNFSSYALLYGQVDANSQDKHMIEVFTGTISAHLNKEIQYKQFTSIAYKPEVTFDPEKNNLIFSFPLENKGIGNILLVTTTEELKEQLHD